MAENTTTDEDVQPTPGAETAQPEAAEVTQPADVQTDTEPSEPTEGAEVEQPSEPESDEKLQRYAQSQGIELDSPSAIKAAKIAMKAQSEATRNGRKATDLEKTMTTMSDDSAAQVAEATGQDPEVLKRLQRMEVKQSINDFWGDNPEARKYEKEMAKIAVESGLYGSPEAILKASYAMAMSNDTGSLKSQAKRETLKSLAHSQQAAVPTGNATTSGTTAKEKPFAELSIKEMEAKLGTVRR